MSDYDFTRASADPRWEHIQFDWYSGRFDTLTSFLVENDGYVWAMVWRGPSPDPLALLIGA